MERIFITASCKADKQNALPPETKPESPHHKTSRTRYDDLLHFTKFRRILKLTSRNCHKRQISVTLKIETTFRRPLQSAKTIILLWRVKALHSPTGDALPVRPKRKTAPWGPLLKIWLLLLPPSTTPSGHHFQIWKQPGNRWNSKF